MTTAELYSRLKAHYSLSDVSICDLHKPCAKVRNCETSQLSNVIDFDKIMSTYCTGKTGKTLSSVDAFSFKNYKIIFVKIKGWKKYIEHTQNITKEDINRHVQNYKLGSKLLNSIFVCSEEVEDLSFWNANEVVYILVTDIDVNESDSALKGFATTLNFLAETSSSIEPMCNSILKNNFEIELKNLNFDMINTIKDKLKIKHYFKTCREFDTFINGL